MEWLIRRKPNAKKRNNPPSTGNEKLCEVCQRLDLTPDKFTIDANPGASASEGRGNKVFKQHANHGAPISIKSRSQRHVLGSLERIRKDSRDSSLCNLVVSSISQSYEGNDKDIICSANWEIDGRESPNGLSPRAKRAHTSDSYILEQCFHQRFVPGLRCAREVLPPQIRCRTCLGERCTFHRKRHS